MSQTPTKEKTYFSLAKWFKWSSIILLLIPLTLVILAIVQYCKPNDGIIKAGGIITIVGLVVAVIWIILNVIMFLAAGNLRGIKSPMGIRVALIIALLLVLSTAILSTLVYYDVLDINNKAVQIVGIILPFVTIAGYIVGAVLGSKIKKALC